MRLEQFKRVVYVNDSAAILSLLRSTDVVRLGPGLSAPDFAGVTASAPSRSGNCQVQINVGWIQRSREMLSTEAQAFGEDAGGAFTRRMRNQDVLVVITDYSVLL